MDASQASDASSILASRTKLLKQAIDAGSILRGRVERVASYFEKIATTRTETVRFDSRYPHTVFKASGKRAFDTSVIQNTMDFHGVLYVVSR